MWSFGVVKYTTHLTKIFSVVWQWALHFFRYIYCPDANLGLVSLLLSVTKLCGHFEWWNTQHIWPKSFLLSDSESSTSSGIFTANIGLVSLFLSVTELCVILSGEMHNTLDRNLVCCMKCAILLIRFIYLFIFLVLITEQTLLSVLMH